MRYAIALFLITMMFAVNLSAQDMNSYAGPFLEQHHKPDHPGQFDQPAHLTPQNQDTTNACWSFATLSFLESEMARLGREPVRLAVMYPFYYMYLEKARYFVQSRGTSRFAPGDLFSGVMETVKKYGIVPQSVYFGETRGCPTRNHVELEQELDKLMTQVAAIQLWDETVVMARVREILNKHLGEPPERFEFKGKIYTPQTFRDEVVALPWNEYVIVTSFLYAPFNQYIKLEVPDNWAARTNFFNVSLKDFYQGLKTALQNGYSAAFDSDTGEPGRMGTFDAAFLPDFDLPHNYVSQEARELRFNNGSTTDDHLMHFLSWKNFNGDDWFLVKDSWRSAWLGEYPGYYFFHGDYVRIKVLAYMVHRDAIPEIVAQMP